MPVTIGGDGSISVPIARAVARCYSDVVALRIDSHTDAYAYDPADKYTRRAVHAYRGRKTRRYILVLAWSAFAGRHLRREF